MDRLHRMRDEPVFLTLPGGPWILQREMNAFRNDTNVRWWWRRFQEWGRTR